MKQNFRLTRSIDFKRVRRLGKSYAHPFVVLIALPNETDHIRVGITASKAVGGAVQRNRAKRLMRAGIAPLIPQMNPGVDILLLARKAILGQKSTQVQAALSKKLKQAELLT